MNVSVIIPTYGRATQLSATLDSLLGCDTAGLEQVEIIVVDDGSPHPAAPLVESRTVRPPISLRAIRQKNAGPAAARNTGFRASRGEIVIFIDDDMLIPPDLIRNHVEAHWLNPGSIIHGPYPYVQPEPDTPFFRYFGSLGYNEVARGEHRDYVRTWSIASGQLSVERRTFDAEQGVYRDDLETPVAEEYELSWRLRRRGVPVLFAPRIVAMHNRPVDVRGMCRQAYTHGRGCAEVAVKCPDALGIPDLRRIIESNGPARAGEPLPFVLKKSIKRMLSGAATRASVLHAVAELERFVDRERLLWPLYRGVLGLYFSAGIREGLRRYHHGAA